MADYTVVKGDTLSKLAKKYNTTVDELARLNGLKTKKQRDLIRIGQTLKLPDSAQAAPTQPVQPAPAQPAPGGNEGGETDWKTLINSIYDNLKSSQQQAIKGRYDAQRLELNAQKEKAPDIYNPLRNEAYANSEMAERSRREAMANMGLSAAGGTSQTLRQRNTNALLNTLGDISRQQQDYTNNIELALGKLGIQEGAEINSSDLQIDAQREQAMLDQGNWEKNYGLQQSQYDLARSDSTFNKAFDLYSKKLITKKQFESMTGLDIR